MLRAFLLICASTVAGCQTDIYLRDGVTDGDRFFLAPAAHQSDDPVLSSWTRYSLILSSCKLQIGGPNPARDTSFDCELAARRHLVEAWLEKQRLDSQLKDTYLDTLAMVHAHDYLDEYVARYFGERRWVLPETLEVDEFERFRKARLRRHTPMTQLTGYWGY